MGWVYNGVWVIRLSETAGSDADARAQFRFALVPDSADARLFVELSGYANADLTEALHALQAAIKIEDAGDPDMLARHLVEFAVVAYCRAFFPSNVRGRLSDHVSVPVEFAQLHEEVCAFRNTTVAHSQSELSTTWPVFLIDQSGAPYVRDVMAANVSQTLPITRVERLITLIEVMIDRVDEVLDPVRERLLATGRTLLAPELSSISPAIEHQLDDHFNARTRRKPYPTQ